MAETVYRCEVCGAAFQTMTDHNVHKEKRHPVVPTKPRIEVVRQNDGRDLVLYDGLVVGQIRVEQDVRLDSGGRRVGLNYRGIVVGSSWYWEEGEDPARHLDAHASMTSDWRFKNDAEYDDWVNGDLPEEA